MTLIIIAVVFPDIYVAHLLTFIRPIYIYDNDLFHALDVLVKAQQCNLTDTTQSYPYVQDIVLWNNSGVH